MDKHDTMSDDAKARVLATIDRPGLTPMQAIASGMITHQQAMEDGARLYWWDIHPDDETTDDPDMLAARARIARSRAISECVQHQRDFYSLQGIAVTEADMLAVATEIVDDCFSQF